LNDATEAGAGFEVSTNKVTIISADGSSDSLPLMSKAEVADAILDHLTRIL
jgi:phosphopantothenoylcysteine decarboxylase/phosphopantothenate--cysteine ligase